MKRSQVLFTIVCLVLLAACGTPTITSSGAVNSGTNVPATTVGSLNISGPWVRATSMGGMDSAATASASQSDAAPTSASGTAEMGGEMGEMKMGAAYMLIANSGGADKLISASTNVAKTVELHTVIEENGVMQMRPVEGGIEVPASGNVELKPGGYHVMLIGLTKDLKAGDTVDLTLQFEKAGTTTLTAQVRNQ